jgi:zinc ribbon protein
MIGREMMYCPGCAAQNPDSAKYCRKCGADLEVVALALAGQGAAVENGNDEVGKPETRDWMKKRGKGVRNATQGGTLLLTSLLIGVALALFTNKPDWMVIWMVFFGWMAGWGAVSLAYGVGSLLEVRLLSRHSSRAANGATTTAQLSPIADRIEVSSVTTAPTVYSGTSVTENTTEHLGEQRRQHRAEE